MNLGYKSSKISNICTSENNVSIHSCSTQQANFPALNVLLQDQKKIWMSENGLPQYLVLDLSQAHRKPQFYTCFGFECWHDYTTNPSVIELLVSKNDKDFVAWTVIHAKMVFYFHKKQFYYNIKKKSGPQFFLIDPLDDSYNFLKISIRETFGAAKTYINQIFLLAEIPKEILPEESNEPNEESNFIINKNDEDILAKYLPNPPKSSEKNRSFVFNSTINSNRKYPNSSKNTATKFFSNHEYADVSEKNKTETNWKANNILKYYDKFLNLKAEALKNQQSENNLEETTNSATLKEQNEAQKSEEEIKTLKGEISKFDEKFVKMQENMEFLIGKQLEMHKSLEYFKDELFNKNYSDEKNFLEKEKKVEIQENEEENLQTSKIYSKLEEFLSRLNEENEKIIEENINLKNILENKVNTIEENLQRISDKNFQEEAFEKKIEELIAKNIDNLSKTMNDSIEKHNEQLEKKMILSLKKSNNPHMNSVFYEPEAFNNSNPKESQLREKEKNQNTNDFFKKKRASQSRKNQLNDFFQKLDLRLSQREKEIEAIDHELLNSKNKGGKNKISSKSGINQKLDFYHEYE